MKVSKSQFTKEEFQVYLREKREKKRLTKLSKTTLTQDISKISIVCLKHGKKYSADYVNILYNMIRRNITGDFNFYCITDNPSKLAPAIQPIPVPDVPINGWWFKPYIFSASLPMTGTVLYLDLDVIVSNNIDKIFSFEVDNLCVIKDFIRFVRPTWNRYNSSVIKFPAGTQDYIWQSFVNNFSHYTRKYHGDQDFLLEVAHKKTTKFFPNDWIMSWKWEIRKSKQLSLTMPKGSRKFTQIENIEAPDHCCIQVLHGDPNPHNCDDPFIIKHWK